VDMLIQPLAFNIFKVKRVQHFHKVTEVKAKYAYTLESNIENEFFKL